MEALGGQRKSFKPSEHTKTALKTLQGLEYIVNETLHRESMPTESALTFRLLFAFLKDKEVNPLVVEGSDKLFWNSVR